MSASWDGVGLWENVGSWNGVSLWEGGWAFGLSKFEGGRMGLGTVWVCGMVGEPWEEEWALRLGEFVSGEMGLGTE